MKKLKIAEAQLLNARLRSVSSESIVCFPNTDNRSVFAVNPVRGLREDHYDVSDYIEKAHADIKPKSLASYPRANWPVDFSHKRPIEDWRELRLSHYAESAMAHREIPVLDEPRSEKFATQFNSLMRTSEEEGWLLGFGWWVDLMPPGDFGCDPDNAAFYRILPPRKLGSIGLLETIGESRTPEWALGDTIQTLGQLGVGE